MCAALGFYHGWAPIFNSYANLKPLCA